MPAPLMRLFRGLQARPRGLLFLATVAAYAPALDTPFQFDDYGVVVRDPAVQSLGAWWAAAGQGLRPLLKLSYALDWTAGGGAPVAFHLINLAIHLVNVELVMRLLTAAHRDRAWPFAEPAPGALVAGGLFALHPLQTEAVTYVSGRSSSLVTLFMLSALLLYAGGVRARRPALWLGLAPLAFAAALAIKEAAVTLPGALLLWEVVIERSPFRVWWKRPLAFAAMLLALLAAAIMQDRYFSLLMQVTGSRSLGQSLAYQLKAIAYLLARLVRVDRLCIDPGLGFVPLAPMEVAAGGVLAGGLFALAVVVRRTRPPVAFGALWFLLHTLFPYLLAPRTDVLNERHMYLAGVGLFLAAGAFWAELRQRPALIRWGAVIAGVVALVLVVGTVARNRDYRTPVALWERTVRVAPANPRAHFNLGIVYEAGGRKTEAVQEYGRALRLEPRYKDAADHLGRILRR